MLELYKNIKKFRIEREMSQAELAKKAGYTDRSSIAKIEAGDVDLPQSKIMLIAAALGVEPGILMGNTGISDEQENYFLDDETRDLAQFLMDNPEYKVLFDTTRKVKPEDIEFIRQMIDRAR